jgi:hypothetical protein
MASVSQLSSMESALLDFTKPLDIPLLEAAVKSFYIDGNQQVR